MASVCAECGIVVKADDVSQRGVATKKDYETVCSACVNICGMCHTDDSKCECWCWECDELIEDCSCSGSETEGEGEGEGEAEKS